jgi:TonB family protein
MKFLAKLPLASAPRSVFASRRPVVSFTGLIATSIVTAAFCLSLASPTAAISQEQPAAQPQSQPATQTTPQENPAASQTPAASPAGVAPTQAQAAAPFAAPAENNRTSGRSGEVTEDELKQLLVGKQLFLRGGYLGDTLTFTEHGLPVGHPTVGSYALSGVEIEKVRLTKHKVELDGARYGLHFLGTLPYEDPSKAVDRVKITPKKKVLRLYIDREQVVKEKKSKEEKKSGQEKAAKPSKGAPSAAEIAKEDVASSETDVAPAAQADAKTPAATSPSATASAPAQPEPAAASTPEPASETAAESPEDQPSDKGSVTSTTSPIHAAKMLREALDRIFAPGLDDKVKAQMPDFWQLYYRAQAAGVDYRPRDPSILRSSGVDQQAKVLTSIAPESNEYAQASGIAGPALYRVVIGADGKPGEIAVERPIGFGLDENAVAAIRKATFQPAVKAGKPVAETLDLAVLFRIYSKRTSVAAAAGKPAEPVKPGPFTVQAEKQQQQQQQQQP